MKLDSKTIWPVSLVLIVLIAAMATLSALGRPGGELISLIQLLVTGYLVVTQRQTDAKVEQVARQTNGMNTAKDAVIAASNPNTDPARVAAFVQATAPVQPAAPVSPPVAPAPAPVPNTYESGTTYDPAHRTP